MFATVNQAQAEFLIQQDPFAILNIWLIQFVPESLAVFLGMGFKCGDGIEFPNSLKIARFWQKATQEDETTNRNDEDAG